MLSRPPNANMTPMTLPNTADETAQLSCSGPTAAGTRVIEMRHVGDLKAHPLQTVHFQNLDPAQLQLLAEDIRANGLQHEPEILPNGTTICGHQRIAAVTMLGWKEVPCWIRHDLAEQGEQAVEARLIRDNLRRRQLDSLAIARGARRLFEMEHKAWRGDRAKVEDLRDQIGTLVGMSGRNLQRLLHVLDAPLPVQRAFQAHKLSLLDAEWVGRESKPTRDHIAAEIERGGAPKDVLAKAKGGSRPSAERAKRIERLVVDAERLAANVGVEPMSENEVEMLSRAADALQAMLTKNEQAGQQ